MNKFILSVFLLIGLNFFMFANPVQAITESSGDIQITYDEPLFPSTIIWYPGLAVKKSLIIKNLNKSNQKVGIKANNTSQTGGLAGYMRIEISEGGTILYGSPTKKTMQNFWDNGELYLSNIKAGSTATYEFSVIMPPEVENEIQSKKAYFDLNVGFIGTDSQIVINGSDGTKSNVCNDSAPGGSPTLISAVAGENSIQLYWSSAPDPITYYLVTFGISPETETYGNPNIGGKLTSNYYISGLSGGITYCFKIRAGNGCKPGGFSNVVCSTPTGAAGLNIPQGFIPGVLGITTPSANLKDENKKKIFGEIKGIQTVADQNNYAQWVFLFGSLLLLTSILLLLIRKQLKDKINS